MGPLLFGAGLALALALLVAIYVRLDGIPLRVWAMVERERKRQASAPRGAEEKERT